MKTIYFLVLVLLWNSNSAQVFNGSFEISGSPSIVNWEEACPGVYTPFFSNDVPGTTGNWSLDLIAENLSCSTYTSHFFQSLVWLTPGAWKLSYWTKGYGAGGSPPSVKVAYFNNGGTPSLTSPWGDGNITTSWIYTEEQFYYDGIIPPDSMIVLIAAGNSATGQLHSYFDGIAITPLPTGISNIELSHVAFHPNPVVEKLWVNIEEEAISVYLSDAIFRFEQVVNFTQVANSLELNLGEISPGIHTLIVNTSKKIYAIRFVKV